MKQKRKNCKGFTLIEMTVALSISGLVLGNILTIFPQISKNLTCMTEKVVEDSKSRNFIDGFYFETRSISEVHSTVPNTFEFTRTHVTGANERLSYSWDNDLKILTKSNVSSSSSLPVKITFSEVFFKYYDKFGEEVITTNVSNINVNAVQVFFKQIVADEVVEIESPIIMFRNKSLI